MPAIFSPSKNGGSSSNGKRKIEDIIERKKAASLVRTKKFESAEDKKLRLENIAGNLAFRQFLKQQGISHSQKELELQEIYNRYFFYRKEEIKK